jgi:hypothetical protein
VIYSLAVSTVFQTFVSSFLVDPGFEEQISTMEEILRSGIRYGMYRTFVGLFSDLPKTQREEMMNHTEQCSKVEDCARKVAREGNYATVLATVTAEYLNTNKTLDNTGVGLLYMLKEINLWTNFQIFLLPRGSEFLRPFNRLVRVAQEAGLVTYFWKDMLSTSTLKSGSLRVRSSLDEYTVFTLAYLQSAFYLLVLGNCCALCTLLAELTCHRWVTGRRHATAVSFQHRRKRRRGRYYV